MEPATQDKHTKTKGNETMQHYISVTIGRNVGNQPMKKNSWNSFKSTVYKAIDLFCDIEGVVFDGEGSGVWAGQSEDAYTIAAIVSSCQINPLRYCLKHLGALNNQEAIAFVAVPLPQGDETLIDCTE